MTSFRPSHMDHCKELNPVPAPEATRKQCLAGLSKFTCAIQFSKSEQESASPDGKGGRGIYPRREGKSNLFFSRGYLSGFRNIGGTAAPVNGPRRATPDF